MSFEGGDTTDDFCVFKMCKITTVEIIEVRSNKHNMMINEWHVRDSQDAGMEGQVKDLHHLMSFMYLNKHKTTSCMKWWNKNNIINLFIYGSCGLTFELKESWDWSSLTAFQWSYLPKNRLCPEPAGRDRYLQTPVLKIILKLHSIKLKKNKSKNEKPK